jgi:DNA invertase Pin-like site-specific DNA recombinase
LHGGTETRPKFNLKGGQMKRAVLYTRVSTCDQNPETQALDLRRLAEQRGFEIVHEYTDRISGAKAKRPALDQMMAAADRPAGLSRP